MKKALIIALFSFLLAGISFSKETGFTQEDRERLIRLEATLKVFMEQVDKRFEQINRELDRLITIMVGIFAGQIALVVAVIGFAYWDRKTIIRET